ncbi:MAG: 23S rRNA (guanosine(2251)-2'-O)-methyltransferase RlmB [Eubacteriales bacterium]|nr:23S rRNA (guanosine(2251)-2'-O)-methyltransferase RlmB [Eubacteriales bacterium]
MEDIRGNFKENPKRKKSGTNVNRGVKRELCGSSYEDNSVSNEGIVSGRNPVKELLASERDIDKVFVLRGERDGSAVVLVAKAKERKIPVVEVEKTKLDSLCGHNRHQGIVAVAAERNYSSLDDIFAYAEEKGESPFIVICDGVEDPHNLGAVIRSAECSGVHGVIIPKRRSVGLTSVVAKASAGAIEHMLIAKVTNIAETIELLKSKGVWTYCADMDGQNCFNVDYSGACALVLGSEGFGVSRLVKEKCDFIVSIPMYGKVNSLNVSNAGAILMTEIARQKHT